MVTPDIWSWGSAREGQTRERFVFLPRPRGYLPPLCPPNPPPPPHHVPEARRRSDRCYWPATWERSESMCLAFFCPQSIWSKWKLSAVASLFGDFGKHAVVLIGGMGIRNSPGVIHHRIRASNMMNCGFFLSTYFTRAPIRFFKCIDFLIFLLWYLGGSWIWLCLFSLLLWKSFSFRKCTKWLYRESLNGCEKVWKCSQHKWHFL